MQQQQLHDDCLQATLALWNTMAAHNMHPNFRHHPHYCAQIPAPMADQVDAAIRARGALGPLRPHDLLFHVLDAVFAALGLRFGVDGAVAPTQQAPASAFLLRVHSLYAGMRTPPGAVRFLDAFHREMHYDDAPDDAFPFLYVGLLYSTQPAVFVRRLMTASCDRMVESLTMLQAEMLVPAALHLKLPHAGREAQALLSARDGDDAVLHHHFFREVWASSRLVVSVRRGPSGPRAIADNPALERLLDRFLQAQLLARLERPRDDPDDVARLGGRLFLDECRAEVDAMLLRGTAAEAWLLCTLLPQLLDRPPRCLGREPRHAAARVAFAVHDALPPAAPPSASFLRPRRLAPRERQVGRTVPPGRVAAQAARLAAYAPDGASACVSRLLSPTSTFEEVLALATFHTEAVFQHALELLTRGDDDDALGLCTCTDAQFTALVCAALYSQLHPDTVLCGLRATLVPHCAPRFYGAALHALFDIVVYKAHLIWLDDHFASPAELLHGPPRPGESLPYTDAGELEGWLEALVGQWRLEPGGMDPPAHRQRLLLLFGMCPMLMGLPSRPHLRLWGAGDHDAFARDLLRLAPATAHKAMLFPAPMRAQPWFAPLLLWGADDDDNLHILRWTFPYVQHQLAAVLGRLQHFLLRLGWHEIFGLLPHYALYAVDFQDMASAAARQTAAGAHHGCLRDAARELFPPRDVSLQACRMQDALLAALRTRPVECLRYVAPFDPDLDAHAVARLPHAVAGQPRPRLDCFAPECTPAQMVRLCVDMLSACRNQDELAYVLAKVLGFLAQVVDEARRPGGRAALRWRSPHADLTLWHHQISFAFIAQALLAPEAWPLPPPSTTLLAAAPPEAWRLYRERLLGYKHKLLRVYARTVVEVRSDTLEATLGGPPRRYAPAAALPAYALCHGRAFAAHLLEGQPEPRLECLFALGDTLTLEAPGGYGVSPHLAFNLVEANQAGTVYEVALQPYTEPERWEELEAARLAWVHQHGSGGPAPAGVAASPLRQALAFAREERFLPDALVLAMLDMRTTAPEALPLCALPAELRRRLAVLDAAAADGGGRVPAHALRAARQLLLAALLFEEHRHVLLVLAARRTRRPAPTTAATPKRRRLALEDDAGLARLPADVLRDLAFRLVPRGVGVFRFKALWVRGYAGHPLFAAGRRGSPCMVPPPAPKARAYAALAAEARAQRDALARLGCCPPA